jgi:pimeloyl-ACP methyl ester carboxylesterase
MYRYKLLVLAGLVFMVAAGGSSMEAQQPSGIAGDWQGVLAVGGAELRILFKIQEEDDALTAVMVSLDQGGTEIPCERVTLNEADLEITVPAIMGSFTGTHSETDDRITGTWTQGGQSFPLDLERAEAASSGAPRPQDPTEPLPYRSEDVTYRNGDADVVLAGTLTLPEGTGPFPAVVLISGSGPQNRNEELMNHRPFLVLADHLTRQGIAVLRFDDRGVGESTGDFAAATSEDFATDALAGVHFLKTRAEIDEGAIGLVGHSEGGLIAPMVASGSSEVSFIVLLAGPGVSGDSILYLQGALIARAEGVPEETIAERLATQRKLLTAIRDAPDESSAQQRAAEILHESVAALSAEEREARGATEERIEAEVHQLTSPWFRFFLAYDPVPALRGVTVPVLALNGTLDLQVPWEENLAAIRHALEEGGNADVEIRAMEGQNHLFQTAGTGSPSEYAKIEETMSPMTLQAVADWILKTTRPDAM